MFVVFLKFSDNKALAGDFMADHNEWIEQGFKDKVFLMVGSLLPNLGGSILANNTTKEELQTRLGSDPFVEMNIVTTEIFEISPAKVDGRLDFLLN